MNAVPYNLTDDKKESIFRQKRRQQNLYAVTLLTVFVCLGLTFFPMAGLLLLATIFLVVVMGVMVSSGINWIVNVFTALLFLLRKSYSLMKNEPSVPYFFAGFVILCLGYLHEPQYTILINLLATNILMLGIILCIDKYRPVWIMRPLYRLQKFLESLKKDFRETVWVCTHWLKIK